MGRVQIDTTGAATGASGRLPRRELWRSTRAVLLLVGMVAGLLGMHMLGGDHGPVPPAAPANLQAGGHSLIASPTGTCAHGQPASGGAMAHCTPAPVVQPPAPPAAVVLSRSDALQPAPRAAVPAAVQPRAPTPDLDQLSISRT
jgi:hypothetical protein